jgi:peptide/nickel transport system permease protein
MLRFLVRRLVISLVMLIGVSIFIFIVLRLLPGDPIVSTIGAAPGVTAATIAALRRKAGLDEPLIVQYGHWVGGVFRGNFGESYFNQYSVTTLIGQRLPTTLELVVLSIGLTVLCAVPLGLLAARRPRGPIDRIVTGIASIGMSLPQYIVALILITVVAVKLHWLPARGFVPLSQSVGTNLKDMILPSVTLAIVASPALLRYLRSSLLEVMNSHYIRTARGKGVSERSVLLRHALRNALVPSLTILGVITGVTLGGAVIIEYMFGLPGLGSLAIDAANTRDYAILQSVTLLVAAMFILTTLAVDVAIALLDPRLRVGRRHG